MRLKYQMFLTLLIISTLMIGLMFAINSWSFSRGFLGYINTQEMQRLEPLIAELSERYSEDGSWAWLENDKRLLRELYAIHVLGREGPRERRARTNGAGSRAGKKAKRGGNSDFPSKRNPSNEGGPLTIDPRVLIADAQLNLLIGRQRGAENVLWQAISVDDEDVGYLGIQRKNRATAQLDKVFEQQQKKAFGYAALVMFALSALLSIPLAARVVKPLLQVNSAVNEISQGHYEHRLSMKRRDEFGDLAQNINHLGATLEKNLEARQRWIAEISHELRTPVAVLQAELEALQDGVRQFDESSVESLHAESLRLQRLINDLHDLSLSDLGALNFQMETVDFKLVVADFLSSQAEAIEQAGLSLEFVTGGSPVPVFADRQRLDQALRNLLQNSLRYTDTGGTVSVLVESTGDVGRLVWEDTAPGVADEHLPNLFDALYRAEESRNRATGGAGLGMSIIQKLVESHSGTISASQSALGGLRIVIELPLRTGGLS